MAKWDTGKNCRNKLNFQSNYMSLKDTLRGTGVALVTPFAHNKSVDFVALHKLLDFVISSGVEYVIPGNNRGNAHAGAGREN